MAKKNYDDNSLKQLKGPDQVRLRPGVIFGSDGLDGCCHSVFEILSNSIDEAREGFGKKIIVTRFLDKSIEVQDYGRGIPIDFNKNEEKYNWELAFCTLYAGGKYDNNSGDNYSYSLGLNGLGLCSTQFAAEYMEVESNNGTWIYDLRFEKGYNVEKEERGFRRHQSDGTTGTKIKWKPDLDVFTDIDVPFEYFDDVLRRQAVVNDGLTFVLRNEVRDEETGETRFEEHIYCYENGISDYLKEIVGDTALTTEQVWSAQRTGKDREDKPEYKVKMKVAFVFSNKVQLIQHYHNSSWLEHGGSPDKAMQAAFTNQIDGWLKANSKYNRRPQYHCGERNSPGRVRTVCSGDSYGRYGSGAPERGAPPYHHVSGGRPQRLPDHPVFPGAFGRFFTEGGRHRERKAAPLYRQPSLRST